MSTSAEAAKGSHLGPATTPRQSAGAGLRARRLASILAAVVVLGWSLVELAGLVANHTTGPELYGVLVAALAVGAGSLTLALLRSSERRDWLTIAVLILWAVIGLGGLAGAVAHVIGPVAGHGPVDPRPRPIAAPLIFTFLGLVGAAGLWFGQRGRMGRAGEFREE